MGYPLKAETNGSGGAKNILTKKEIEECDGIIIAGMTQYCLPGIVQTLEQTGNINKIEVAGIDFNEVKDTEAAKKLTKDDGSQYGLGMRNDNNQAGYYNLIYDNGGYIISDEAQIYDFAQYTPYEQLLPAVLFGVHRIG